MIYETTWGEKLGTAVCNMFDGNSCKVKNAFFGNSRAITAELVGFFGLVTLSDVGINLFHPSVMFVMLTVYIFSFIGSVSGLFYDFSGELSGFGRGYPFLTSVLGYLLASIVLSHILFGIRILWMIFLRAHNL